MLRINITATRLDVSLIIEQLVWINAQSRCLKGSDGPP